MVTLADVAAVVDELLVAARFRDLDDPNGVWQASDRPVETIGLALEPWPGIESWVEAERIDALWIHRPWDLPLDALGDVGVLAYHHSFDERMTTGYNPDLAAALGITDIEVLGRKQGRPLGMTGTLTEQPMAAFRNALAAQFEGSARLHAVRSATLCRVAIVGAMWPELIEEAERRGANAYVTGTFRERARAAVEETGLTVITVGHAPPERWGARRLAVRIAKRLPALHVVLAPGLADTGQLQEPPNG